MASPDRSPEIIRTNRGTLRIRREPDDNGSGLSRPLTIIGRQELTEPPIQRLGKLLAITAQSAQEG